jgi:hypothetical protein
VVLNLRLGEGLPLHVPNRIGTAAGERHDVIPAIIGARTAWKPCGRARVLTLVFSRGPPAIGALSLPASLKTERKPKRDAEAGSVNPWTAI